MIALPNNTKTEDLQRLDHPSLLTAQEITAPSLVLSPLAEQPIIEATARNVGILRLKAYRVDLPVLFALGKDSGSASTVNLAGIDPVKSWEENLAGDSVPRKVRISLGAAGGSAKVVEFSTIILRSDLEMDIQPLGDRLRIHVYRKGADGKRLPQAGAQVRVAAGGVPLASGMTDARGVFQGPSGGGGEAILAGHDGHFVLKVLGEEPEDVEL